MLAAVVVAAPAARAERRPPFGSDAVMLETRVREEIERRVTPLLTEMAPGQADLKYVDVRVTRPTALPSGAAPGFEELSPATEFVAEKAEVALVLDAKLPAQFRKDLKNLIKSRLDGLAVPIEIQETVLAFPTPRPLPPAPREPAPYAYPPPAAAPAPAPAPAQPTAATPATAPVPAAQPPATTRAMYVLLALVAFLTLLVTALGVVLAVVLMRPGTPVAATDQRAAKPAPGTRADAPPAADHLPEVRRALREDRLLARRVMSELLRENQLDKVARTVELVGPGVVEDLRGDPAYVMPLRQAAALLVESRAGGDGHQQRELVAELHRRVLKHRMIGAEDPVEQEFAFLLGLSPARLAAVLAPEPASVQAAALRYAPAHLRAAYLAERSPAERSALAAALASSRPPVKDHLLDVASTLRARAAEHAHVDSGETGEVDLAVELVEERPPAEQAEMLEAMRRADPAKARAVQAALITDHSFELVSEEVLAAASLAVATDLLVRFLRVAPDAVVARTLGALPPTVAASVQEELSLDVTVAPQQTVEARRALYASLRKQLRDRGLPAPGRPLAAGADNDKGKVVAL
jgi:flagellar motor switch protein FliG